MSEDKPLEFHQNRHRGKYGLRGGDVHNFPSKIFCPTVPKIIVEEPFCAGFQKISCSDKFMDKIDVGRVSIKVFC